MTLPSDPSPSALGGRIGSRIAGVVADGVVNTRQRLAGHTAGIANQVLTEFTNHVSDEIRGAIGPLWAKYADAPDTPEDLRPLFHRLATERGQAWAWIAGSVASTGIAGGLSGVFQALLAPTVHATNAATRFAILSPADAARAEVIGRTAGINMETEMAFSGFSDERQQVLLALAHNTLPPDVIVELYRRKVIPRVDAVEGLRRNAFEQPDIERMLALRDIPLSPPDAAAAWARSELTEEQTNAIGALSGVSSEDMRIMRALAGQPPSPEELLFAWRRGIIQESDVDRGIIQGPIRNEWIPVIKSLQWNPMPVSEAADAVNQGHMPVDEARKVARENGFRDDVFDVFVANAGIPPGPQETLDWVNRGLLTEAEGLQALYESRIKNKWVPKYMESRFEVMPPETIRLMYSRGAMSKEDAIRRLQQRGYSPEDAAIVIDGASSEKTEKSRDLTVAQTLELRAEGLITEDDALVMLQAAGYDVEEALWVTQLADIRRVARFVTAAVNRTKASYVAGRLDEIEAGAVLDRLGLPAQYKENAFALWDLERTTVTKGLTAAQVVSAVKNGFLTPDDGVARLTGQGYAIDDAIILLRLGKAIE